MVIFASTSCGYEFTTEDDDQEWYDKHGHQVTDEENDNPEDNTKEENKK